MGEYEHPSMSFAERFIKLRKEMNVSLRDISRGTGIGVTTLRHYESGTQPGFDNVIKLSEYFGVSLDYLAYGYTVHSHDDDPPYSFKEKVQSLLENMGVFNVDTDEYHMAKVYCPSYCTNKDPDTSLIKSLEKDREKTKDKYSNYSNDQLKKEMIVDTTYALIRERSLLESIALYLYSTDKGVIDYELAHGAPMDILSTSESHHIGRLISKLDEFKNDYYSIYSPPRKNKTLMFLED